MGVYSADTGQYERFINKDGKATGIKKRVLDIGRNDPCPCGAIRSQSDQRPKKYKNCCLPKGIMYTKKKSKIKGSRKASLKIRLKRLFKLR